MNAYKGIKAKNSVKTGEIIDKRNKYVKMLDVGIIKTCTSPK